MPALTAEETRTVRRMAESLADAIAPLAAEMDEHERYDPSLFELLRRRRAWELLIPTGGAWPSLTVQATVVEELASRCPSTAVLLQSHATAVHTLVLAGTPLAVEIADAISEGRSMAAFALTEPEAGSDVLRMKTAATRAGGDYVLNGEKRFITNAGIADHYVVFARTGAGRGGGALSAFAVPASATGVAVTRHERKMGLRASPTGDVVFKEVRVPAANRLGEEGDGMRLMTDTLRWSRPLIGAMGVGLARGAYLEAALYSSQRRQFEHAIVEFQAVGHLLADMLMSVLAARALLYNVAARADEKEALPEMWEAAAVKAFCTDVAMRVATDAVQVFGGYGYVRESAVERLMRDAKVLQIFEGTNQIQRNAIMRAIPELDRQAAFDWPG